MIFLIAQDFVESIMLAEEKRYSRQELIDAMEKGWKHYLPCLAALSEEEQARYAQEQGFSRVQDVLVHIFAWWDRSMQRTAWLLSGPSLPPAKDHPLFCRIWTNLMLE